MVLYMSLASNTTIYSIYVKQTVSLPLTELI
nr:MAG TPA: hypothetical protein [Caudoviricetes sp.]